MSRPSRSCSSFFANLWEMVFVPEDKKRETEQYVREERIRILARDVERRTEEHRIAIKNRDSYAENSLEWRTHDADAARIKQLLDLSVSTKAGLQSESEHDLAIGFVKNSFSARTEQQKVARENEFKKVFGDMRRTEQSREAVHDAALAVQSIAMQEHAQKRQENDRLLAARAMQGASITRDARNHSHDQQHQHRTSRSKRKQEMFVIMDPNEEQEEHEQELQQLLVETVLASLLFNAGKKKSRPTLESAKAPSTWNQHSEDAKNARAEASSSGRREPGPFAGRTSVFLPKLVDYSTQEGYEWVPAVPEGTVVTATASDWMQGFDRQEIVQGTSFWKWQNGGVRSSDLSKLFGLYGCIEVQELVAQQKLQYARELVQAGRPVHWWTESMLNKLLAGEQPPKWGVYPKDGEDDLRELTNRIRRKAHWNLSEEGNKYTRYGKAMESTAIEVFERATGLKVNRSGFCMHPFLPDRGASNDGFIRTPSGRCRLVEAKCPYGKQEVSWSQLELDQGVPIQYMFQIQFEMVCHGSAEWVDYVEFRRYMGTATGEVPRDDKLGEAIDDLITWYWKNVVMGKFEMITAAAWLGPNCEKRQVFVDMLDRAVRLSLNVRLTQIQEKGDPVAQYLGEVRRIEHPAFRKRPAGEDRQEPAKASRKSYDQRSVAAYLPVHQDADPLGRVGEILRKRDAARKGPESTEEPSAAAAAGRGPRNGAAVIFEVEWFFKDKDGVPPKHFSDEGAAKDFLCKVVKSDRLRPRLTGATLKRKTASGQAKCKVDLLFKMDNWTVVADFLGLEDGPLKGFLLFPTS